MGKRKKPVSELPVMKSHCKTCPFKLVDGKYQDTELANKVIERTLFKAQQICHHNAPKQTHRCKGAYDHNLEIYKRLKLEHLLK